MIKYHNYLILLLLLPTVNVLAKNRSDQEIINFLKSVDFEKMTKIEVTLDKVFDVFDGLVKMQKVSVASGIQQSADVAPAVTTVITAQDIEASGASTLEEILQMVPGLNIDHANNNTPLYTIRGIYSSQNVEALFMINDVPLKSAFYGNRSLYDYSPSVQHIARIEVIRGPGSAIYGADAFSGAINIITKDANEIGGTEVGVRFGSFDTQHAWALHGGKIGDIEIAAAVQYESTDGPGRIIERDLQTSIDEQLGAVIPGYQPSSLAPGEFNVGLSEWDTYLDLRYDLWQLQLNHHAVVDRQSGAAFAVIDPLGRQNASHLGIDLKWHNPTLTPYWDVAVMFGYKHLLDEGSLWAAPPGSLWPGSCDASGLCFYPEGMYQNTKLGEQQNRFAITGIYRGFDNHTLRLGAGYTLEDLYEVAISANYGSDRESNFILPSRGLVDVSDTPASFYSEATRKSWHVVLQDTWQFLPGWELTAGVRHDNYSDFGGTTNPRAALSWRINDQLTSRLLYGKAFRAPTFLEQFVKQQGVIAGDPNLSPETINNYELAFDYQPRNNLYLMLNFFSYDIRDKILLVDINNPLDPTSIYQNRGYLKGRGLEFETRLKTSSKSSLLFNYSWVNVMDRNDLFFPLYSQYQAYFRTDWLFYPRWYLNTQLTWAGGRKRPKNAPDNHNYTTLDLTVRYKPLNNNPWNIAFGVRNLFDVDIRATSNFESLPDYLQAGQSFFLEVRRRFK